MVVPLEPSTAHAVNTKAALPPAACDAEFNPSRLVDALRARLGIKRDADLAKFFDLGKSQVSRMRTRRENVGASFLVRFSEATGWSTAQMRVLMADRRRRFRLSRPYVPPPPAGTIPAAYEDWQCDETALAADDAREELEIVLEFVQERHPANWHCSSLAAFRLKPNALQGAAGPASTERGPRRQE